jgi:hypothetical protein
MAAHMAAQEGEEGTVEDMKEEIMTEVMIMAVAAIEVIVTVGILRVVIIMDMAVVVIQAHTKDPTAIVGLRGRRQQRLMSLMRQMLKPQRHLSHLFLGLRRHRTTHHGLSS